MSDTESIKLADRQIEAEEYIQNHKIIELFTNITSHLVFKRPGNNNNIINEIYSKTFIHFKI